MKDPYVKVHIANTALHYGQSVFEGLKAFHGKDGRCERLVGVGFWCWIDSSNSSVRISPLSFGPRETVYTAVVHVQQCSTEPLIDYIRDNCVKVLIANTVQPHSTAKRVNYPGWCPRLRKRGSLQAVSLESPTTSGRNSSRSGTRCLESSPGLPSGPRGC